VNGTSARCSSLRVGCWSGMGGRTNHRPRDKQSRGARRLHSRDDSIGRLLAPYGVRIGSHWRIPPARNPFSEFKLQDDPIFGQDGQCETAIGYEAGRQHHLIDVAVLGPALCSLVLGVEPEGLDLGSKRSVPY